MEWPSTIAEGDAVIVRAETPDGLRFVVWSRRGPQLECRTYIEAETQALGYTVRSGAHAWYADANGPQLITSSDRPLTTLPRRAATPRVRPVPLNPQS